MTHLKIKQPIPEHFCNIDHTKSSGPMEAALGLSLVREIHEFSDGKARVAYMVSDDDTTLRSHASIFNGGKLEELIEQPKFLTDPDHRIKVMISPTFKLVKKTKHSDWVKNINALRLKSTQVAT